MTDNKKLAQDLQELIQQDIDPVLFPVKKGNHINIGSCGLKPTKKGWSVKSYVSNEIIAVTFTKAAAIAIAKNIKKKKNIIQEVMELDNIAAKHHMDCVFYEYTMKKTTNPIKFESTANRYDISKTFEADAMQKIKSFIL